MLTNPGKIFRPQTKYLDEIHQDFLEWTDDIKIITAHDKIPPHLIKDFKKQLNNLREQKFRPLGHAG